MNGPWTLLNIAPTSDVRAIKRAYAAQLKQCRPEEDADRFMALRQAYEWALNRASILDPPIEAPVTELAEPFAYNGHLHPEIADFEETRPPPFNPRAETEAIFAIACDPTADHATVTAALTANPAFWNLDHKPMVSALLAARVCQQPARGLKLSVIQALGAFFHWNDITEQRRLELNGIPTHDLQARLQAAELDVQLRHIGKGAPKPLRLAGWVRRCGTGPLAWLWAAILWRHIPRINELLSKHPPLVVEFAFGPGVLRFWQSAAGAAPNLIQFSLKLARTCLFVLGYVLLGYFLSLFSTKKSGVDSIFESFATVALAACEITTTLYALRVLAIWSRTPPHERCWILPQWVNSWFVSCLAIAASASAFVLLPVDFMPALLSAVTLYGIWAFATVIKLPPLFLGIIMLGLIAKTIQSFSMSFNSLITVHIWLILPLCVLIITTANLIARPLASRLPAIYHRHVPPYVTVGLFMLVSWLGATAWMNVRA